MRIFKSGGKLHWVKNLYKRYRYGAGCCDTWNTDVYLAKKILPALKEFKKGLGSYPMEFESLDEWVIAIDKMIWSFEYLIDGEDYVDIKEMENLMKKEQEGFELFGKHFRGLWQ